MVLKQLPAVSVTQTACGKLAAEQRATQVGLEDGPDMDTG